MATTRKQRYDIALNGVGLVLASKPQTPKIVARQDDVFQSRFAQGDRDYYDLVKWWYMAQTDWLGGFKDKVAWADDAKYYYSINIDAYSEQGAIKLERGIALDGTFTEQIICGFYEPIEGKWYLGTDDTGSTKPAVYIKATAGGSWSEIANGYMPADATAVMDILTHKDKMWYATIGAASTYVVYNSSRSGGGEADFTGAIGTACDGITVNNCYSLAQDENTIWAGVRGTVGQNYIAKSVDNGANWTKVLGSTTNYEKTICMLPIGTDLYYLGLYGNSLRLKMFDGSATTTIYVFPPKTNVVGTAGTTGSGSRKLLQYENGKVIVTLRDEIWEYDVSSGSFTRIYETDANKQSISNTLAVGDTTGTTVLPVGPIYHNLRHYWSNLIYDGEHFYNGKGDVLDSDSSYRLFPLFSDGSIIYWVDNNNFKKLYKDSGYKGTADKNYLVFNNFDRISGIDKLAYSITLIFKTLISGQKIAVEYTTGELTSATSWTALGNASFAGDGGITTKTLYFGDAVTYKKMWFRVKLEGGGSDTPVLYDFIHAYLPKPDDKLRWDFAVKCLDEQLRKDQTTEPKNGLHIRNLLREAWKTKSILTFEDADSLTATALNGALDATSTTITVDSTDFFPERGRILIDSEEILYTGKTKTTFTGCTRGAYGSVKASHSDNADVSCSYRVIVRNYKESLLVANDPTIAEYEVEISLSEV